MEMTETAIELPARAFSDRPEFSLASIEKFPEGEFSELKEFAVEEYWCDRDSINVFDVSGTRHPDYQGMTWLEFLERGKRMKLNLSLFRNNPGYYLGDDIKLPTMSYIKLDGRVYIDEDGYHRTCIARFYFYYTNRTNLHGVTIREYITDRYTYKAFKNLKELLRTKGLFYIELTPFREKLSRKDTAGWMREHFRVGIKVRNEKTDRIKILQGKDILNFIQHVNSFSVFKKVVGMNEINRFLR